MGDIITIDSNQPKDVKRPGMKAVENYWNPKAKSNIHTNFLMIPLVVSRSKVFMKFLGSPESRVWFLLQAYIRRALSGDYGDVLYKKYYRGQGKLVARWDQDDIADMLGLSNKSKSSISKAVKKLAEHWKFIIIHQEISHMKKMNVYELGYLEKIEGEDKTVEHLYLIDKIIEANQPVFVPKKPEQIVEPEPNGYSKYFQ